VKAEEDADPDLAPSIVAAEILALDRQEIGVTETETTGEDPQTVAETVSTAETATATTADQADAMTVIAETAAIAVTVPTTEEIEAEAQMTEEKERTVQEAEVPVTEMTGGEAHPGKTAQRERSILTTAKKLTGTMTRRTQSQIAPMRLRTESMRCDHQLLASP